MTFRSIGGNWRNGVKRSHEFFQVITAWGYFCPSCEASNSTSAAQAASSLGAV